MPSRRKRQIVIALAVVLAGASSTWLLTNDPASVQVQPNPTYVGNQSCRECHPGIYDSYQRHPMNRTWQTMATSTAVANFDQRQSVEDPKQNLQYELYAEDGRFFQKELRRNGNEVSHELDRLIQYAIGSGEHAQGYVSDTNGYLNEMPVWYFHAKSGWELSPSARVHNLRFERPLTAGCVSCHTDSKQIVPGTFNLYSDAGPEGISCERCHGPGEWHVREHRDGWEPPEQGGGRELFVNPARLSAERQNDLCFQCHLMGDAQFPFPEKDPLDFKPGLRLADFRCDFIARPSNPDAFGIVSHAARMVQSRCYTESGGRLTCLTCHDPHVASREIPLEIQQQKCLNCHGPNDCSRLPSSSPLHERNDCIACHMPRGEPTYVEHTVYTDHWIRRVASTNTATEEPPGQLVPLDDFWNDPRLKQEREGIGHVAYAIFSGNLANLDRGVELLAAAASTGKLHREGWRRLGMGSMLRGDARLAMLAFDRGVREYPEEPMLQLGLGSALRAIGDRRRALEHLEKTIELAPGMIEPYSEAAGIYLELQQTEKARELLLQTLERYPHQANALAMLGMCFQVAGDVPRAIDALQNASRMDPDRVELRLALVSAHIAQNDTDAAYRQTLEALRITPKHPPTLILAARVHLLRQEKQQAIDRLQQVLELEPDNVHAGQLLKEISAP